MRRFIEMDCDVGDALRQPLAAPQIERDACPAPVVDEERYGRECVGLRIRIDARLVEETGHLLAPDPRAPVLAGHRIFRNIAWFDGPDRAQEFGALVAH